jgi:hypothetical protein
MSALLPSILPINYPNLFIFFKFQKMDAVGLNTNLFLKTLLNGKPIIQVLPNIRHPTLSDNSHTLIAHTLIESISLQVK